MKWQRLRPGAYWAGPYTVDKHDHAGGFWTASGPGLAAVLHDTKDEAQRHAQLALYQLAIAEGLMSQGQEPGGGRLVYLGKTSGGRAAERVQDALTPESQAAWREKVHSAAAATQGPQFVARINDGCAHCPVRKMCPAQVRAGGQQ